MRGAAFFLTASLLGCGAEAAYAPAPTFDSTASDAGTFVADASSAGEVAVANDAADAGCMTCVGAPMPTWELEDFQPKSSGFGKTYGLSAFKPKVTVVALLAAW